MKPNWVDAPKWAKWLAMDRSGNWHWFASEPEWKPMLGHGEWDSINPIQRAFPEGSELSKEQRP